MIKQSLIMLLFLGLFTACQSEAPKTTATDEAEKQNKRPSLKKKQPKQPLSNAMN